MKKRSLPLLIFLLLNTQLFAQQKSLPTIDSLKKQIPHLSGIPKVDCLNLIVYTIDITGAPGASGFEMRGDSAFHYSDLAYNEAKRINYKKGMADALFGKAHSQELRAFGLRWEGKKDSAEIISSQKYSSEAISIARELNDDDEMGKAYLAMDGINGIHKTDTTDYMKKSAEYFQKAHDDKWEGEVSTWVAEGYMYKGYYEDAFDFCRRSLLLNRKALTIARTKEEQNWRNYLYQQSLADMATLYKEAGDYQSALDYLTISSEFAKANNTDWDMTGEKTEIWRLTGQYDSAFFYLRKELLKNPDDRFTKQDLGATFLMANQYDSALVLFKEVLPEFRKINRANGIVLVPILYYTGSAYAGKKEYETALIYAREAIANALIRNRRPDMMNGYKLLSDVYHGLRNNDSAYFYIQKYIELKDSIQNRQFLFRLNSFKKAAEDDKKQAQIMLLDQDNKIKQQQLKQETSVKKFLIIVLIILMMTGIFIFRNLVLKRKNDKLRQTQAEQEWKMKHLESEKKQIELQRRAARLEMQALRAQMNPHFIFNSLSSINWYIMENDKDTASDYLTRFSRLIRMVLNSQKPMIPLEDELKMLQLYLDMERLRLNNSFDYSITFTNAIDAGNISIPPMLLQPFCENAIWHGLTNLPAGRQGKDGHGHININIKTEGSELECTITDNGIGRKQAAAFGKKTARKEKSLGLEITRERLALFNEENNTNANFEIVDMTDENEMASGTKVILKIGTPEAVEDMG